MPYPLSCLSLTTVSLSSSSVPSESLQSRSFPLRRGLRTLRGEMTLPTPLSKRPAAAAEEEPEIEAAAGPEMVSLEDVEAAESGKAAGDEDVDLGEEVATADDAFLEEEEEGEDDVTGLIDGDIEDDEET